MNERRPSPASTVRRAVRKKTVAEVAASVGPAFPIVGIGASAGGLEALEQFLRAVPPASGMAFVIIQHLDPTRKGIMPQILQRATGMKVAQARDRTVVRPDHVYVIPPNKNMSILRGVLHLLVPTEPRGLRLPIDFFLSSLAQDREAQSIGVILSGMGTDGTLGLRGIKEKAGFALVQDPVSAKFDGMPGSAIAAGLADVVAPVEELPARIVAHLHRAPLIVPKVLAPDARTQGALDKIVILLRSRTGQDFSMYKRNTILRRIERRMGIHQIGAMAGYVRYLQENPAEVELLFKELLIGVTEFFRDAEAWNELRKRAIPALLANRPPSRALRAWVAGCSSGEEAYSLAIVFREAVEALKPPVSFAIQIFATDLDRDAIARARQGFYPKSACNGVSPERLSRFFVKEDRGYRVRKEIRESVIFAPQNLIMDPPFTKLDILSCRNLLIYLLPEVQRKLIPLFHYSLSPGGLLFLGSAETIGSASDLFAPVNARQRIYRRVESGLRAVPLEFPSSFNAGSPLSAAPPVAARPLGTLQAAADQLILRRYAPPAVLVDERGDILYVSGRTGRYLEPAAGRANWNLFPMLRDSLRFDVASAFQKAVRRKEDGALSDLKVTDDAGDTYVDVAIHRIGESESLPGLLLIVFREVPPPAPVPGAARSAKAKAPSERMRTLKAEMQRVLDQARRAREDMQSAQEEFRSANEELQSANEELQSANEELTTSKEEMQSLNEELQTVNAELQSKMDENTRTSNDMKNLLNSTDIATLFLDGELNVRWFTSQAAKVIKLIPRDAGRPVTDLVSNLNYPALADDVRRVLRTLVPVEKTVMADDNRWFDVRIMPYRTLDDRIDGAVITFSDVTVAKTLEGQLRSQQARLEKRIAAKRRKTAEPQPNARS